MFLVEQHAMANRHPAGDRQRVPIAGRIDDHQRAGRVRDQLFERIGREPRVEQKRNSAGPHRPEEELDELHSIADQHGDALARTHAQGGQHARHAIHALIELPVGGCALAPAEQVNDGNLVRKPANRVVEKEAEIASTVRVGVVHHRSCYRRQRDGLVFKGDDTPWSPLHDRRWRCIDIVDQRLDLDTGDRSHLQVELRRFKEGSRRPSSSRRTRRGAPARDPPGCPAAPRTGERYFDAKQSAEAPAFSFGSSIRSITSGTAERSSCFCSASCSVTLICPVVRRALLRLSRLVHDHPQRPSFRDARPPARGRHRRNIQPRSSAADETYCAGPSEIRRCQHPTRRRRSRGFWSACRARS